MRNHILWVLGMFLAGCVAVRSAPDIPVGQWAGPTIPLTNVDKVETGMSFTEVAEIMGSGISVGYREEPNVQGEYEEVFIRNPYASGILTVDGISYRVAYYVTYIRRADGVVSSEEMIPFVFQGEELIGKGWTFLEDLKTGWK